MTAVILSALILSLFARNLLAAADQPEHPQTQNARTAEKTKASEEDTAELEEVSVQGQRIQEQTIHKTQSITTINASDLSRIQPSNIFDAIRNVPGVAIEGGPRPSGMSFNIRGYVDNEDVMVKVDGVQKGFEKYRMGGTFIEPELLKSIEVQRGPQISSGSGSLGGTIIATTKNAADLLEPGKQYGARAKFGYANNNDEYSRSYIAYARPHERVDVLLNYSNRQSNNIERPDGTPLEDSAISSVSKLFKLSLLPIDSLELTTSIVSFKDSGLQPYDATGGQPGTFGNVIRAIDDLTWSQSLHFTPDTPWVDLKASVGRGHTKLHDLIKPGMSSLNDVSTGNGNLNDYYKFETTTVDIANTSTLYSKDNIQAKLLAGYQYNENKREVERYLDNKVNSQAQYPNGFNRSAPPGTKTSHALYFQPTLAWGPLSVIPGVRHDQYKIEAAGGTLAQLNAFKQSSEIDINKTTYSLGLAYELIPKQLTLFSNYGQGFRPPLVDEYFTQGPFSRCLSVFMPHGPASQICGDVYQLQTSESTEVGMSYLNPRLFDTQAQLTSKFTYFHNHTSHLLNSLGETTRGEVVQRGVERRNGIEIETALAYKAVYGRIAYSRISGSIEQDARNGSPRFNTFETIPLYTVPGNTLSILLGAEITKQIEANINYRKVSDRVAVLSGGNGVPLEFTTQDGYEVWNAGIHWTVNRNLGLRLIGENITNEEYNVNGGFGSIGTIAPGRNLRFITELTY